MEDWLDPCLDADEMRATDAWAIKKQRVPSLELMESAGRAVAEAAAEVATTSRSGDRLRQGKQRRRRPGRSVGVARDGIPGRCPAARRPPISSPRTPGPSSSALTAPARSTRPSSGRRCAAPALSSTRSSARALPGSPRDPAAAAIDAINEVDAPVVATDVSSGVNASTGEVEGTAVAADVTVTFHAPKIGHWVAPGKEHTGELQVAPIGIPEGAPVEPRAGLIDPRVLELAPSRAAGSTKFSSGQVVIIGGSRGLTGAVCLASLAAVRTGAGLCDGRGAGGPGADLRGEAHRGDDAGLREPRWPTPPGRLRADPGSDGARGLRGPRLGHGPRPGDPAADPGAHRADRGAIGDRRRRPQCPRGPHRVAGRPSARHWCSRRTRARWGGCSAGSPSAIEAKRVESAREAATAAGAIVLLKGDDSIVTDGERLAVNRISARSWRPPGPATSSPG